MHVKALNLTYYQLDKSQSFNAFFCLSTLVTSSEPRGSQGGPVAPPPDFVLPKDNQASKLIQDNLCWMAWPSVSS